MSSQSSNRTALKTMKRTSAAKARQAMIASAMARATEYARRRQSSSQAVTIRRGLGNSTFMPERLITTLENTLAFYIPAGNATAAYGNYMDVMVNSLYQPFQTSYIVNTAANLYSIHGSLVQGYTNTQAGLGYSTLAGLYTSYKVKSYVMSVCCQPANSADATELVVCPIGNEEIPSSAAGSVNLYVMLGQPHNKSKLCVTNCPPAFNSCTIKQNVCDLLGRRPQQWMDEDPTPTAQQPAAANRGYAGIFLQQTNGSNNAAAISCTVKLWQTVEFTDLIAPVN